MSDEQLEEAAKLFGVLSEPARLALLRVLMRGRASVGGIVEATGMKQGTVSKHLAILHAAGFLSRARESTKVYYAIADPTVQQLCELMCQRIRDEAARNLRRLART